MKWDNSPVTTIDVLKAARTLLGPASAWIQGNYAQGPHGPVGLYARGTCQWCLMGALIACSTPEDAYSAAYFMLSVDSRLPPWQQLITWNDAPERTHADVLDLLDRTIARIEEEKRP